jgi:hypothetical protein
LDVSPTITTTTDLKGMLSGLVYNGASAMTNYYGHYIAAPTGTGTITNKYALVTEATAGNVGIGTTAPLILFHASKATATTNAIIEVARFEAIVTDVGVGAAGFGPALTMFGESATNTSYRQMGQVASVWVDATDASRKARSIWSVWDTAEREGIRIEASGTAPMVGFLGAAAVVRPTALTVALTTITCSAPGTPDYAIADLVQNTGYGFVSADEGQSALKVIANLQTRVGELESKLQALGLLT